MSLVQRFKQEVKSQSGGGLVPGKSPCPLVPTPFHQACQCLSCDGLRWSSLWPGSWGGLRGPARRPPPQFRARDPAGSPHPAAGVRPGRGDNGLTVGQAVAAAMLTLSRQSPPSSPLPWEVCPMLPEVHRRKLSHEASSQQKAE